MTGEETSLVDEATERNSAEQTADDGEKHGWLKRFAGRVRQRTRGNVASALLALLVVASATLAAGLFYFQYRPDRATDAASAKSVISAATEGTVAVLTYAPNTLDRDLSSAKSHLTGDFLSYYSDFTQQIVTPAVKQKSVKTTATVLRAAISELHPKSAVVLLFVNQSTASADRPEPTTTASSVLVTLTKADGRWLISSFNPV